MQRGPGPALQADSCAHSGTAPLIVQNVVELKTNCSSDLQRILSPHISYLLVYQPKTTFISVKCYTKYSELTMHSSLPLPAFSHTGCSAVIRNISEQ